MNVVISWNCNFEQSKHWRESNLLFKYSSWGCSRTILSSKVLISSNTEKFTHSYVINNQEVIIYFFYIFRCENVFLEFKLASLRTGFREFFYRPVYRKNRYSQSSFVSRDSGRDTKLEWNRKSCKTAYVWPLENNTWYVSCCKHTYEP